MRSTTRKSARDGNLSRTSTTVGWLAAEHSRSGRPASTSSAPETPPSNTAVSAIHGRLCAIEVHLAETQSRIRGIIDRLTNDSQPLSMAPPADADGELGAVFIMVERIETVAAAIAAQSDRLASI